MKTQEIKELDELVAKKIETLSSQVNDLLEEECDDDAVNLILEGLELIPEPKQSYLESTWLYSTLGDIYYFAEEYDQALCAFLEAINCPDGLGNPFIHLRMGQCFLEVEEEDAAADNLMRAYMGAGIEIFDEEEEKYLDFLRSRTDSIE